MTESITLNKVLFSIQEPKRNAAEDWSQNCEDWATKLS